MKKRNTNLGDKIFKWRNKNKVSQEDFAKLIGVTRQTVIKWEGGEAMPQSDKLQKISETIGVGLDQLMVDVKIDQAMAEVAADEVAKEKKTLSPKAKLTIAAIVILIALLFGIILIIVGNITSTNDPEGTVSVSKFDIWNFSMENVGWIMFGVSISASVVLGVVLICKTVVNKKKLNDKSNGVNL
ncbi:MAG: helix-turn-helix domain-containing protein [Clostridia bacterium]|nr:helix-turn-helix domain-containing protein [Clostridia bacterium]